MTKEHLCPLTRAFSRESSRQSNPTGGLPPATETPVWVKWLLWRIQTFLGLSTGSVFQNPPVTQCSPSIYNETPKIGFEFIVSHFCSVDQRPIVQLRRPMSKWLKLWRTPNFGYFSGGWYTGNLCRSILFGDCVSTSRKTASSFAEMAPSHSRDVWPQRNHLYISSHTALFSDLKIKIFGVFTGHSADHLRPFDA